MATAQTTLTGIALPQADLRLMEECEKDAAGRKERQLTLTADDARELTDLAVGQGNTQATKTWNARHPTKIVSLSTTQKYKDVYKSTKAYFVPAQNGRPAALTEAEV